MFDKQYRRAFYTNPQEIIDNLQEKAKDDENSFNRKLLKNLIETVQPS